jgi:hypothetical protein
MILRDRVDRSRVFALSFLGYINCSISNILKAKIEVHYEAS